MILVFFSSPSYDPLFLFSLLFCENNLQAKTYTVVLSIWMVEALDIEPARGHL